jgi:hypothetical protein
MIRVYSSAKRSSAIFACRAGPLDQSPRADDYRPALPPLQGLHLAFPATSRRFL